MPVPSERVPHRRGVIMTAQKRFFAGAICPRCAEVDEYRLRAA